MRADFCDVGNRVVGAKTSKRQNEECSMKNNTPMIPFRGCIRWVLYHGKSSWTAPTTLHEYLGLDDPDWQPFMPNLTYSLLDLTGLSDAEIRGTLLLEVVLKILKHVDDHGITDYVVQHLIPLLHALLDKEKTGLEYIEAMLNYLFRASESFDEQVIIGRLQQLPDTQIKEIAMTAADRLIAKGFQEGEVRGEAKRTMKMLQLKFQSAAKPYTDRVLSASEAELDLISERLLTADSIKQVFEGL